MGFSNLIDNAISRESIVAARGNFGTGMLVHYHTKSAERVIEVASAEELVTDFGFDRSDGTDAVFLAKVDQIFAQNPKPASLKIGRRALAPTQVYTLSIQSVAVGDVVSITFEGTECSVTVDGSTVAATATAVGTALAALINAIHSGRAANSSGVVTVTASAAGILYSYADWNRFIEVKSTTTDAGVATDLGNILTDDDDWIAFDLVDDNEAEVEAAAAWAETNKKMFWPTTPDTNVRKSAVTNDVGSDLKTLAYDYTQLWWNGKSTTDCRGFALFCSVAAFYNPGRATFAHKTIKSTEADDKATLRTGEISTLESKRVNFYAPYLKVPTSWSGVTCSGEWSDIIIGTAWLDSEIKATLFETIRGADGKMSYTDEDITMLVGALGSVLERAESDDYKLLAKDPKYTIDATKAASLSSSARATRDYDGLDWTGTFAGAVHSGVVRGKVAA